jgi:H+/Cl- antiporter ClcA/CBS domain-containing protein
MTRRDTDSDAAALRQVELASTTEGLPVSPSMGPALQTASVRARATLVDRRVAFIALLAVMVAVLGAFAAEILVRLIHLVTDIAFYGRFSLQLSSPADNHLGAWVIGVPVIGAVLVGLMARYGSEGIRGHGIPEAMERVLMHQSRIPPRLTFLKPISAALSIGTGGPFGAEGPIIATGGAMGSLIGQLVTVTATERKTLLAAGAAAGMTATFGTPVSAVLLAIELLLFEFRPRSLIPVALASVTATAMRFAFRDTYPMFQLPPIAQPGLLAMMIYVLVGVLVGCASIGVTRSVYLVEDLFAKLPLHWMWWPAVGALAVGIIGYICPRTLGVGYENISALLGNNWTVAFVLAMGCLKFLSWSIALGSGTSGGTLAPLFTIGSALGLLIGRGAADILPQCGVDPRVAALVGMAAMFAGASRAVLASVVFAFETTLQPMGLLPLLGGCAGAFFVSCLLMPHTIMTEKIARRGVRVPEEYTPDFLQHARVGAIATRDVVTLKDSQTVADVRLWMSSGLNGSQFGGYPIVDGDGTVVGMLAHREIFDPAISATTPLRQLLHRPVRFVYPDTTLREAMQIMTEQDYARLAVVERRHRGKLVGIVTGTDLLRAQTR